MRFGFSDDQRLLQSAVREMLQKECPPELVRELWTSETGRSPELWAALADMGVLGILVPEPLGGLGMDERDLVLLLEESGRVAVPGPLVETAAVAAPALRGTPLAERWLPAIAAGDAVVTIGLGDDPLVTDAHLADLLLLERDGELHAVERANATVEAHRSVDGARRLFSVEWAKGLPVGGSAVAFDRAALGTAAQLIGLARHLLDTTVAYAGMREQFGVPIGSFQAVKHQLANALMEIEFARPLVYRAAGTLEPVDVSTAKAAASDAASFTARVALQVHGAIGYTFEYDLQLWMKRVWALAAAWGDASWHRRRVSDRLLGPA
jgi:alkylation response protein AidB-like acyl-CoA dehydrogenase